MLTISHDGISRNCDGLDRRDFLKIGALAVGGLSLPSLFQAEALGAPDFVRDRSVVVLFLSGGASHIETFNPNMTAPAPYRSITGEVSTRLPGVTYGGTFPQLAMHADRIAVVRSFQHPIGGHVQAIKHVLNGGTDPDGRGTRGFSMGSASSRLGGANNPRTGMPTFTLLNSPEVDPQYRSEKGRVERGSHPGSLGAAYAPFQPGSKGASQLNMELNIPRARLDDRRRLLTQFDRLKRSVDVQGQLLGADKYRAQAFDLILGSAARAFDLDEEPAAMLQRYDTGGYRVGKKQFRQSLLGRHFLTARRLIESGCRFVTVHSAGWDMHADGNNPGIAAGMEMLGRPVDRAVSAFLQDLVDRGLDDRVLLVITGDFGRTPKINGRGGRDHWPRLCTLAFAGGGISGQVVGRSAPHNDIPDTEPIGPRQLVGTVMHWLFDMPALRLARGIPRPLLRTLETSPPIPGLVG